MRGPDYVATHADLRLLKGDKVTSPRCTRKSASSRYEKGGPTDVAIRTNLLSDVYAVIGDPDGKGGFTLRLYYNPLVP